MTWSLANASKSTCANASAALANGGTLKIYTGPRPATPDTAITTQALLATLTFSGTAFGGAANGVATANAIAAGVAVAAGTAAWGRVYASNGTTVVGDCDCGTSASNVNFPSLAFTTGQTISCSSLTLTQP